MLKSLRRRITAAIIALLMLFGSFPALAQSVGDVNITPAQLVTQSSPVNGMVRVYLSSLGNPSTLNVTTQGSYLLNGDTSKTIPGGTALTVQFQSSTGRITLSYGGATYQMGDYFILRRTGTEAGNSFKIKQARESGNPYPGDLSFRAVKQSSGSYKLYTIAHIYIEDYLYGVLPYEMGNSSHLESLKAQAVAARTYTVRMMESRSSGYYDVVDTTSDQVYRGTPSGNANCVAAVDQTRGIVLKYGSAYAVTYYSASNGGQTESLKNVKGSNAYPYLVVKDDPFDYANPSSLVKSKNIYVDLQGGNNSSAFLSKLQSKTVAALQQKGYNATASNTVLLQLKAVAPHTPKYASPSRLYTKMDFTLTARTGAAGVTAVVTVTFDIFSELESLFGMSIQSASNELWSARRNSSGSAFVLEARRYGHGYGMSQRGAMYMGKQGYTYDQILGFYYEGTTRVRQSFVNKVVNPESGTEDTVVGDPAEIPDADTDKCTGTVQLVSNLSTVAVRNEKSNSAAVLIVLNNGALVEILSVEENWCLVRAGEIVGYLPSSALKITGTPSGEKAEVTKIQGFSVVNCNDFVNLRSGPSMSAQRVTTAPTGSVLTVFSVSGQWARVQYGNVAAYVNMNYVSAVTEAYPQKETISPGNSAVVTTESGTGTVNLRATASTSGQVLKQVPVASQVTVLSDDGAWARIRFGDLEGYMMSQYLTYQPEDGDKPQEPVPPDEPPEEEIPDPPVEGKQYIAKATPLYERAQEESPVLATLAAGQEVEVLISDDGWTFIRANGQTGYVPAECLMSTKPGEETPETPDEPPKQEEVLVARVTTASGSLNLRAQPSLGSRVLTTIPRNAVVEVSAYGAQWCSLSYGDVSGYAMTKFLSFESTEPDQPSVPEDPAPDGSTSAATVVTPSGSLNLRESPVSGSRILRTIPRGASVEVHSYGASWCHVTYAGTTGYVMTAFLSFSAQPEETPNPPESGNTSAMGTAVVTTASGSLNLRNAAGYHGKVLLQIPQYASVEVLAKNGDWTKVRFSGTEGYVVTSFLTFGEKPPQEPSEPENTPEPENPDEETAAWVKTPSGSLNLREEPESYAKVLLQIPRGAELRVLNRGQTWCRVVYKDIGGYVMTSFLSFDGAPYSAAAEPAQQPPEQSSDEATEETKEKTEGETLLPIEETTVQPEQTEVPAEDETSPKEELSQELEVLSAYIPVTVMPKKGEECPVFSEMDEESSVLQTLRANEQVILWMQGPDWCLVQYDAQDETKLAYIRTHHLQMTGE